MITGVASKEEENFSDTYVSFLAANKVSCRQNSSNRKAGIEDEAL
jgi:hypothetical protein